MAVLVVVGTVVAAACVYSLGRILRVIAYFAFPVSSSSFSPEILL